MRENYTDNQKLFYVTLKQMRNKKPFRMKNMKDKNGKVIKKYIMERRHHFMELTATH